MGRNEEPAVPRPLDREDVLAWLRSEYAHPFVGWDFSHVWGNRVVERDVEPWIYEDECITRIRGCRSVIDLGTGDGMRFSELLERAGRPTVTRATEGYPPNLTLARNTLEPLGVEVMETTTSLPTADRSADLIIDRHTAFDAAEVFRVLTPGGTFVVEQIGRETFREIHEALGAPWPRAGTPQSGTCSGTSVTLAGVREAAQTAGLVVDRLEEAMLRRFFLDVGALVWYLKAIPFEVPDFDVDRYADRLVQLHHDVERDGPLDTGFHKIFLVAHRPG